jgi:ferredoxin-NADP reductase
MSTDWTQAWRDVTVTGNREAGRGCRLLRIGVPDDLPFPFEPGHVVVLRAGGHRHPYTVSQADPLARELTILIRIIPGGRLTPLLETAEPGQHLELSGLHHEPVRTLIAPGAAGFVGLSTGSGIGPLWGFAEQALASGFPLPITLFAGFREVEDPCLAPELDALQALHPRFQWHPTLTQPAPSWTGLRGRVGESAPPLILEPRTRHFHLVGNGAMLADLKAALALAGVPEAQVSSEVFFNYNAEADPEAVQAIVRGLARD